MTRFIFLSAVLLSTACEEGISTSAMDTGYDDLARAAAPAKDHGGSVECGEQNVEAYENSTRGDICVHVTFTNDCDEQMDIEPPGDDDTVYLDSGKTKTYSWTAGAGETIEFDCDGSCEGDECDGCTWSLSFGGTCSDGMADRANFEAF